MVYSRQSKHGRIPGGFLRLCNGDRGTVCGFGEGEYIRMRDEYGNTWVGSVTRDQDNSLYFRFRDHNGNHITGVSDTYGVVLRDEKGRSWRGFLE